MTNAYNDRKTFIDISIDKLIRITRALKIKLNIWLTAPEGATPYNQTSETDRHMAVRGDNVIIIISIIIIQYINAFYNHHIEYNTQSLNKTKVSMTSEKNCFSNEL